MMQRSTGSRVVELCSLKSLQVGRLCKFEVSGIDDDIVVLRTADGQVRALGNHCPHKRAKLHKGDLEDLGDLMGGLSVQCPKHRRKFGGGLYVSMEDGLCRTKVSLGGKDDSVRKWRVPLYHTRISDGKVFLVYSEPDTDSSSSGSSALGCEDSARVPQASYPVVLHKVEPRSDADDARDFTFRFQDPKQCADFLEEATAAGALGSAWHIGLRIADTEREYTPITSLEDAARTMSLTLLIRLYHDGEMSQKLRVMRPGAAADISCPRPTFGLSSWIGPTLNPAPDLWSAIADNSARFGMICAGTGAAVGYQALGLVVEALSRRAEPAASSGIGPCVGLLFSHRESCPLMVDELLSLAQAADGAVRLRVTLTANLEVPPKRVRSERSAHAVGFFRGRVDESMLRDVLPVCSRAPCLIVVTGPRGFNEHCARLLSRLDHADSHIIVLDA